MKDTNEKTYELNPSTCMEMPRYKCHKEVHALKIAAIEADFKIAQRQNRETTGGSWITPADAAYAPFHVQREYCDRHKPEVGGYYVVYADGYKSYSPAKAFEDGYARVS